MSADEVVAEESVHRRSQHQQQRRRPGWWRRLFAGKFLIVSIAVHLLFAGVAAVWVVQRIHAQRKLTFSSAPPTANPAAHALEHRVQMARKQKTLSAPAPAK